MYQIIIDHSGLSLGEIEVINNLFSDYATYEKTIDNDFEYASILELEFIKDKEISFFDYISIEKWTFLIEIIKNIKKRRGKKGLRFKITITDVYKPVNNDDDDDNDRYSIFSKTLFLLNHKNDLDFIKGLERIEITIENIVEIYEVQKMKEEQKTNNKSTIDKDQNKTEIIEDSMFFVFDEIARKWVRITNKATAKKNK
ncbi:MAG TPA: hypothetical protein VN703_06465 [Candidatus Sulfopaludibacter sp.]|nr:hypothetical protein [Candidatus Sulfopaludibacter sp.]